ncbi:MAG TPA: squalene/phytoene synthase family protein [Steroidobacteraceae bacterium]
MNKAAGAAADDPLRRGTPPGSLRYFSTLFAPAERRPLLDAIYAFEAEIAATVNSASHEVAHTRMQWWRAEADRYAAGRAQHPVTVAMQALHGCASHDPALLHEILTAADLDLAHMTYASQQELEAYAYRASGALQTLIAAALAGPRELSAAELRHARTLGSALRQTEMLRDLTLDAGRGRVYLPLDALDAAGIDPSAVRAASAEALRPVLEPWHARLVTTLAALPEGLTGIERSRQRPGLVLAALHLRLLERLDPARPAAPGRADVSPWSRLWTAWTTAVRYA